MGGDENQTETAECAVARGLLKALLADQDQHAIAIRLLLDGCEVEVCPPLDSAAGVAINHVLRCASCKSWRETSLESKRFARRDRITRYCCAEMFSSISGELEGMTIRPMRGQPEADCWVIAETRIVIQFCPWCGEKLPAKS